MKATSSLLRVAAAALFVGIGFPSGALAQGALTPPGGPPAAGGRTLLQIKPHIPLQGGTVPAGGGALFNITQPGSYYLTADIVVPPGQTGVRIASDGVVLDLNGFRILGATGAATGVFVEG